MTTAERTRELVIDADLPRRLATELKYRRRSAVSLSELQLAHAVLDPEVLRGLAQHYDNDAAWVLVTGDDTMPAEHGRVLQEVNATVATIHPEYPAGITEDAWRRDITHRWAHAMQMQEIGTVRRYSARGSLVWRPRRRHLRRITKEGWTPWRPTDSTATSSGAPASDPLPGFDWS